MIKQLHYNQKKFVQIVKFLICLSLFVLSLYLFYSYKTFSNIVEPDEFEQYVKWDGVSVSDTLSGSGSESDPYLIFDGADYIYMKSAIENGENEAYYMLMNNIDFQNNIVETIGNDDINFQGIFDGNGYSLANMHLQGIEIEGTVYNGIFTKIVDGSVSNLNLKNVSLIDSELPVSAGTVAGSINSVLESSYIRNVGIYQTMYSIKENDVFGGVVGYQENSSYLDGVFVNLGTKVSGESGSIIGIQNDTVANSISHVVIYKDSGNIVGSCSSCESMTNLYLYETVDDIYQYEYSLEISNFVADHSDFSLNDIASMLTNQTNDMFTWKIEEEYLRFDNETNVSLLPAVMSMPIETTIPTHESGVDGTVVYINDLESDWNYYMGRNYNESSDGKLPSGVNQDLYNESNMVKVAIRYSGKDLNNDNLVGYLGPDELYDTFVYYRYYPVSDNKVTIELIDNPFSDYPNNMAFNGWITDYVGAVVRYSNDYYVRYVDVPITMVDGVPQAIEITMYADWTDAAVGYANGDWDNVFSELNDAGFYEFGAVINIYEDVSPYFIYGGTVGFFGTYPSGAYNNRGQSVSGNMCFSGSCTYYLHPSDTYNENQTYYYVQGNQMREYQPQVIGTQENEDLPIGIPVAGYYRDVHIENGNSLVGYYDEDANYVETGICSVAGGCDYYELIPYYDSSSQIEISKEGVTYYRLTTRDTNIVVLQDDIAVAWTSGKPFTLTGYYNDVDYRSSELQVNNMSVVAYGDLRIENITVVSGQNLNNATDPTSSSGASRYLYGRYNNVKIGRGIRRSGSNATFVGIIGGDNSSASIGSESDPIKYRLIVESGWYNTITLTNGPIRTSNSKYVEAQGVYGNDYDRIHDDNDNLEVYFDAAGAWGGVYYSSSDILPIFDVCVLSGEYGTSKYDYTTGIYVGGRSSGTHNNLRRINVKGGWIYNLIGGPMTSSERATFNDTDISMTGGAVDVIIGGAGTSATYGNRLIQVTGGQVNYSVFGGSNGYQGSGSDGTVNGSSFIYIGGDAIIGDSSLVDNNSTIWGAEAGSVFGIGNGRTGNNYVAIGSNDNSNIIIDSGATIRRNVYGGGNFGATGISSNSSSTTTKIQVLGGLIEGSLYGGGNNNGAGSSSKTATVSVIMTDGVIQGSLYGGSNQLGTIYGDVDVQVLGGTIENSIYGGGEGGYASSSSVGTFVSGNVNVVVGNRSYDGSVVVNDSVYGGSAYGSVNGSTHSDSVSSSNTTVTINDGVISNVYGGGEGNSTYTPYVMGNVNVYINGGNISNVYGGNDAAGTPNGTISVYLNGGMVTNAYGGGNQASILTSDIYLNGSNAESIYGGGNQAGADDTNVHLLSGSSVNVYGGSNQSGDVGTTNVMSEVSSDTLSDVYFDITITQNSVGADEQVDYLAYTTLNVKIVNNTSYTINNFNGQIVTTKSMLYSNDPNINVVENNSSYLFDGMHLYTIAPNSSYELEFSLKSYFDIDDFELLQTVLTAYDTEGNQYVSKTGNVSVMNIYGGNNLGGVVNNTNVDLSDIHAYTLYGGGNQADVSGNTDVVLNQCVLYNDVFGGGNQANVGGNTLLNVTNSSVEGTVYGGGNAADVLGNVTLNITDGSVEGSVYGGGNSADVLGNTYVTVGGNIVISENLFGGGNSGAVGSEDTDQSKTVVNLYGGTIGGNVYGGCNTSVVYGTTDVNIGGSAANNLLAPIYVVGTVFGGGEANASGSEVYDFSFISVTKGIDIYIDGTLYNTEDIKIGGSIFGSGNASSSSGYSNIYVRKLGSAELPNKAISIQRANEVVLDNSVIELVGTTDRTNEYSDIKYSFNRIDLLKIKNNTRLLLQQNANLLKEFQSLVGEDGSESPASVQISEDGTTVRNVDNRLYMIANKNLNVTTNEAATAYGKVTGMTFFGMYTPYSNGSYAYGIYNMENNDKADAGDVIIGGSYVLGLHALNMDYEVDGFYTNYIDEAYTHVTAGYIEPTPPSSSHYIWAIGLDAINYSVTLTASKYASLGTHELKLLDFASGNTTFEIIGFNSEGLTGGVDLVDSNFVPKIADTPEEANQVLGLSMKAETTEWTGHGATKFLSENNGAYTGMDTYLTDNQAIAPSFTFYLYHAKNITLDSDLGTVVITLNAKTPINEIEYELSLVTITIDLTAKSYSDQAAYDASITYGRKYEMPSATDVNITNRSEFTAYYSLYQNVESIDKIYGFNKDYYRVLTSNYVLPVGTKITMIDLGQDLNHPKYYYYQIDDAYYQEKLTEFSTEGEATYALNQFIAMDSISEENHYDDSDANLLYYHDSNKLVMEEFIFIFDFEDTTISGIDLDNSMILELRNNENRTSISVLGIRQGLMKFHLYDSSNVVLDSTIEMNDSYFYYDIEKSISYHVTVGYDLTDNLQSIVDTNYEANSMGINIRFKDGSGNYMSSSMLIGTSVKIGGNYYYPSSDGVFRIKLADKVSNLSKNLLFIIGHNMPSGTYTMEIDLFSSTDGLYPSKVDKQDSISFTLVGSNNSLDSTVDKMSQVLDGNTGLNLNGSNELLFHLQYLSELNSPNIRLIVYRRNKDSYQSSHYEEIDARSLTTTTLTFPSAFNLVASSNNEYIVSFNPTDSLNYKLILKDNLESGTYRFVFRLYDANQVIDESEEYIIVKRFEETDG